MSNKADCRTAPATPGLLKSEKLTNKTWKVEKKERKKSKRILNIESRNIKSSKKKSRNLEIQKIKNNKKQNSRKWKDRKVETFKENVQKTKTVLNQQESRKFQRRKVGEWWLQVDSNNP